MSGDVTYGAIERLTFMPDRDDSDNGDRIAGQYYWDIDFRGGSIANVTLTDVTINGVVTERNIRIITDSGNVTTQSDDYIIELDKTVGQATTVELPLVPTESRTIIVKDVKGDAETNNITVDGNGFTIDGLSTFVINENYGAVEIVFNGTEWNVLNAYKIGGGGVGDVISVNGQNGVVVLDTDDISEGSTNLYFTNNRAINSTLTGFVAAPGTVTSADSIITAIQKVVGNTASTVR